MRRCNLSVEETRNGLRALDLAEYVPKPAAGVVFRLRLRRSESCLARLARPFTKRLLTRGSGGHPEAGNSAVPEKWCAVVGSPRDLQQIVGAGQMPGVQRCLPRVQVGLAGQAGVERLQPLGCLQQQRGASLPGACANATCPRSKYTRALANSSSGPASAVATSSSALPNAPACAAASVRPARRPGSADSSTKCSQNDHRTIEPTGLTRPRSAGRVARGRCSGVSGRRSRYRH